MPSIPDELLTDGDWTLVEETTEIVFQLPTAQVRGHTRVYEDGELAEEIETATDVRRVWRFVFATDLSFIPPLPPNIGPTMILPTVVTEARQTFIEMLRDRGVTNICRGRRERTRTDTRGRVRLQEYRGSISFTIDDQHCTLDVTGWLGVWTVNNEFCIAGGAYPNSVSDLISSLPQLTSDTDIHYQSPNEYRRELFDLIQSIS